MAAKLKAAGFDTYVTTTGGTQVAAGTAPAPAKKIEVGSKVKIKEQRHQLQYRPEDPRLGEGQYLHRAAARNRQGSPEERSSAG
jgi:hypothetical protein